MTSQHRPFPINLTNLEADEGSLLDAAQEDDKLMKLIDRYGATAKYVEIQLSADAEGGDGRLIDPGRDVVWWCKAIGSKCTQMEHINFAKCNVMLDTFYYPADFPVRALWALLTQRENTLQSISIQGGLPIVGTKKDYRSTFARLVNMPNLKKVEIDNEGGYMKVKNDRAAGNNWAPDALLTVLSQVGSLEEVCLAYPEEGSVPAAVLRDLCQAGPGKQPLSLSLYCHEDEEGVAHTFQSVCGANSRICKLWLLNDKEGTSLSGMLDSLLESLRENSSIIELDVEFRDASWVTELEAIINDSNSKLLSLLQHNTCLSQVKIDHETPTILNEKVQFWLKMNGLGRGNLEADSTNGQLWMDALVKNKDDHPVVFHLLSSNPSIFFADDLEGDDTKPAVSTTAAAVAMENDGETNDDTAEAVPEQKKRKM